MHASTSGQPLPFRDPIIDEFYYDGSARPRSTNIPLLGEHRIAQIIIRQLLYCVDNFYGSSCAIFCEERDDSTGHYTCESDGTKLCLSGYTDPDTDCTTVDSIANQDTTMSRDNSAPTISSTVVDSDDSQTSRNTEQPSETSSSLTDNLVVIVASTVLNVLLLTGLLVLLVVVVRVVRRRQGKHSFYKTCTHLDRHP